MPGTPPARGRRPLRPARLRCPRRDAAVPSFRLRFRKRFRVPGLVSRVCRITPLHAGSLTSRGTELCPGSRESPQPGEACLQRAGSQPLPGLKLPPGDSGSFSAKVEAHASNATGTERCLSPAAAGEQPWEAAGRPTLAGRAAPPHCSRSGVAACVLETSKHSQTQPGFHLRHCSLPCSPTQTRGSQTPLSAWPGRPAPAIGTTLGRLIQGENGSAWPRGAWRLFVAARWPAQGEHGPRHRGALKRGPRKTKPRGPVLSLLF